MPLFVITGLAITLLFRVIGNPNALWRASMASGYVALGLLAVTLSIGPIHVLRRRPTPVSTDLRRDIGVWAGALSLVHVVFGLQVHLGNPLLYFVELRGDGTWGPRISPFGLANYTGAIATILVLMLLGLSNDWALRKLGTLRWKQLQRWTYALGGLVVVHGALYQIVERRSLPGIAAFGLVAIAALALQLTGRSRHS